MNGLSDFGTAGDATSNSANVPSEGPIRRARLLVGPLGVDPLSQGEFVQKVLHAAFTANDTHLVATANAQFYVLATRNQEFAGVLSSAEFVCADGISILLASRLLTGRGVDRIPGVDLISSLCEGGAPSGLRIFLIGGRPGSAMATAEVLLKIYSSLTVVGVECPPLGFEENEDFLEPLLRSVNAAKPHIVFVGLGAPKQELFIDRHLRPLRVPVAIGVGGSFDMYSGQIRRAPEWMRELGLEWCYRLVQEPSRLWRRYLLGNTVFCFYVLRDLLKKKVPALWKKR